MFRNETYTTFSENPLSAPACAAWARLHSYRTGPSHASDARTRRCGKMVPAAGYARRWQARPGRCRPRARTALLMPALPSVMTSFGGL